MQIVGEAGWQPCTCARQCVSPSRCQCERFGSLPVSIIVWFNCWLYAKRKYLLIILQMQGWALPRPAGHYSLWMKTGPTLSRWRLLCLLCHRLLCCSVRKGTVSILYWWPVGCHLLSHEAEEPPQLTQTHAMPRLEWGPQHRSLGLFQGQKHKIDDWATPESKIAWA